MKKRIKRTLLIIALILLLGFLYRGWIYRHSVHYSTISEQPEYPLTNNNLKTYIDEKTTNFNPTEVTDIIKESLKITSDCLNFRAAKNDNDPNKLIDSKNAHCVGYAAFFSTTCNYLLEKNGYSNMWTSKPLRGQIYFFGTNIHKYFNSPFFRDHDFNCIENMKTGEKYFVDPTVNDYLWIDFISERK